MSGQVVVVGGGVVGVTTAAALAHRGFKVTLLERAPTLGSGVTARNGAQLSYTYADALGAPSILRSLPRLLSGLEPSFRIYPGGSPGFLPWVLRFLSNCTTSRFVDNTRAVLRLALRSRAALARLLARLPRLDFHHSASGKLHIYQSEEKLRAALAGIPLKNELGCGQRAVGIDELFAMEPALSGSARTIVGAIYSPIDEAGDSSAFSRALAERAAREYGLVVLTNMSVHQFVLEGRRIRAVSTQQGPLEADTFVLAAGPESASLASTAGLELPIFPMKGYSVTLPATPRSPYISITDTQARIVFCRLNDSLRIAGMAELGRADTTIPSRRIDRLLQEARACLPAAAEWHANPNAWTGLRPMTPDCRPIIGYTPIENLVLNCGHGMLGWTLACGSAELVAALLSNERLAAEDSILAQELRFTRFIGRWGWRPTPYQRMTA